MRAKWLVLLVAVFTIAGLSACGSSGGGGDSDVSGGTETVQTVGIDNCEVCHHGIFDQWSSRESGHGNVNARPDNSFFNHDPKTDCTVCHDPTGDSAVAGIGRPVVGCEGCHGGGSAHRGVGPIPVPSPTVAEVCSNCHSNPDGHPGDIVETVLASMHNGGGQRTSTTCQRCHTTEGFIAFSKTDNTDPTVDDGNGYIAPDPTPESWNPPICLSCHDEHTTGMRVVKGWDPNKNGVADQFDTCTACHTYYNNDGDVIRDGLSEFHHEDSWYRLIPSTHYDDPTTGVSGSSDTPLDAERTIEGYVVRENGENACFDCHSHDLRANTRRHLEDPTSADRGPTVFTDWANSNHAGGLLKAKVAAAVASDDAGGDGVDRVNAVMVAGATINAEGVAWADYNWDRSGRGDCQRCHTATGASNFLNDPANYVAADNDFSHLVDWSKNKAAGSPQNEMLYCWGCHTDTGSGALRKPGALTIDYSNDASATFPDSAASNVCISCHSGRENGDSIKNDTDADGNRSFLNSHYLTAGGIVFATGGYEYAGGDYDFTAGDSHQNIGYGSDTPTGNANFDAVSDDYTSGPCVTCHFNSSDVNGLDRSHTLSPFTETAAEGTVLNAPCVVCHTSRGVGDSANIWFGMDFVEADFVAGENAPHKGRLLGAQLALKAVLASKGILSDFSAYPYFFQDSGFGGGIASNGILDPGEIHRDNGFKNWASVYGLASWKDVMGAAFNLNLIAHDPGAAAHNRRYARRLIYDSIDFMDDGIMNDSTNATVTAQAQPFTASALNYVGSRP